ncbi:hypothetical protein Glove_718g6 [Diversispora epigaea]|uniref:Uncharacterized protein n=1 Tax=Diversispora epigaea TaxID=1348612 RepID=A0A397G1I6_9GLOM|nr:hypothetical protein Glove_718g6 [Diversispora epigaea]
MAESTTYFDTPSKEWSFLGYYKHRRNESDFTFSFRKESFLLKKYLESRQEKIPKAKQLAEAFANHRRHNEEVDIFWNEIELTYLDQERALRTKRCHVNISSKTQDMMENMAEETVEQHLATKSTTKKDSIDTFFQDPSDQRSTKFIKKLQELEIIKDDSNKSFDEEDEAESESQNSFSASKNDNDSDYISSDADESTSDASEDNDDLDYNNDLVNEKDPPKIDKVSFCKAHNAIPDTVKLKLSTGKIVEDVLFKFCKDMNYEHHAHSYIVDFDDEDVRVLFTDEEWNELTKDRIGVPAFPRDVAEELAKYGSKTLKELRTKVMKSYLKNEEEYDVHKHYNQEWIQMTMRTLCNLFENIDTPLVRTQYEDWFTVALFGTCIDFCIRDAQLGTDVKRFYPFLLM